MRHIDELRYAVAAVAALSALTLGASLARADAPGVVDTRIDAVTVHPSHALVSRIGKLPLREGASRLRITGLPAKLDDRSVRLVMGGDARPTLVGFAVATVPASEEVSPESRALEEELRALQREDASLDGAYQQVGDQRGFLTSMRSTFDGKLVGKLGAEKIDPNAWTKAEAYIGGELGRLLAEARRIAGERRVLARKMELVRKKQEQLRGKRGTSTKTVTFEVRAPNAGAATLTLRYLVPDVRWQSLYDARLLGGEVELVQYALVTQESGEDWDNVVMTVSTSDAGARVRVPKLTARNLGVGHLGLIDTTVARTRASSDRELKSKERALPPPPPAPEAEMSQAEFVVRYSAATRVVIPSSPAGRKTPLGVRRVGVAIEHIAMPARALGAYMIAKGRIDANAILPAGDVSLFFGAEYVGATHVPQVAPGGELRLPFGRDERVRIQRVMLERKRHEEGVFSKSQRYDHRYEIRVENQSGRSLDLVVLDQHPVSQHADIKVELLEDTTPRSTPEPGDAPGVLRWRMQVVAGARASVKLGFSVTSPAHRRVWGLPAF